MPITETKFGVLCILTNLWWDVVMVDWNLDGKLLSKWRFLQHCTSSWNARILLQGMTNIIAGCHRSWKLVYILSCKPCQERCIEYDICHPNLVSIHPIIETKFGVLFILTNMWWDVVMVDWNLDEKLLSKWQYLQNCTCRMPKFYYKEWPTIANSHRGWQLV